MSKIALGTAQFGLNYGISNKNGIVNETEVFSILKYAAEYGIDTIDTAFAYGESESVIGRNLDKIGQNKFKIITKIPPCKKNDIIEYFNSSLTNLHIKSIYAVMFHNFKAIESDLTKWDILNDLRDKGKVKKIGVSLYHPEEWEYLILNNIHCDIIQIPFNIFDQRFLTILEQIKTHGTEIHVRSVFLQGLFFLPANDLIKFFDPIKHYLDFLNDECKQMDISIASFCLSYANSFDEINKIVVGVDTVENLKENVNSIILDKNYIDRIKMFSKNISIKDKRMVLPYLWPVK